MVQPAGAWFTGALSNVMSCEVAPKMEMAANQREAFMITAVTKLGSERRTLAHPIGAAKLLVYY